jgi:hypothetical protein
VQAHESDVATAAHGSDHPDARRHKGDTLTQVRASDLEPYVGLRYLSKLFRFMAIILLLLLVAEVVTGFIAQGREALPTLLAEVSRLLVLAGLLWGIGDLAILLIDVGHDVRAARILLSRQVAHHMLDHELVHDENAAPEGVPREAAGRPSARDSLDTR